MFEQPYFVGPYIGAIVAALFWMTVNYVRYNYDHNYVQLKNDVGHDRSRDADVDNQRCVNAVKDDQRK